MKKKTKKRIKRIIFGIILFVLILFAGASLYTYFYGNGLLKDYIIQSVENSSKGAYHAKIRQLSISLIAGNVSINGFEMTPDTIRYKQLRENDSVSPVMISLKVGKLKIRGLNLKKLIQDKVLTINRISIESPELTVVMEPIQKPATAKQKSKPQLTIPLPKKLVSIEVGSVILSKGKLTLTDMGGEVPATYHVPGIDVVVQGIRVNSRSAGDPRILNADDITVKLYKPEIKTKNGMYSIFLGEIGVSTGQSKAWIRELKVTPLFSQFDFTRELGYQTDRLVVQINKIDLDSFDLRQMILARKVIIGKVTVDGLNVDDYRDKRVPMRQNFFPKLPQQALLASKTYLKIDEVEVRNGKVTYSEQVGSEPGTLFFDKISGTVRNLVNDSLMVRNKTIMTADATLYLMGKGKLHAKLSFILGAKNDAFVFSGTLDAMDLKEINPMVTKLAPAEIAGGRIKKLEILPVMADDFRAKGSLNFYYNGLDFNISSKKTDGWSTFKGKVVNFVASVYVSPDNPTENGKFTPGIIYFERDRTKGIFNYLWKSTFSGLKSSMNVNNKKQKEIKKAKKKNN